MALRAELEVDMGDGIVFQFAVVNAGSERVELTFSSGQHADIAAIDADSEEPVWQWSDGKVFTQVLHTVTLEPDGCHEIKFVWSDPSSGTYTAVATLEANVTASARATFTV